VNKHTTPEDGCRLLWAAVIHQALEDLDDQPYGSITHNEAVAFFTRTGLWGGMREEIADSIDLHADHLRRIGQSRITARTARTVREPLPAKMSPVALAPLPSSSAPPLPPSSPPLPAQLLPSMANRSATRPSKAEPKSSPQRERHIALWLQKWKESADAPNEMKLRSRINRG
jgi:hypothetical protein